MIRPTFTLMAGNGANSVSNDRYRGEKCTQKCNECPVASWIRRTSSRVEMKWSRKILVTSLRLSKAPCTQVRMKLATGNEMDECFPLESVIHGSRPSCGERVTSTRKARRCLRTDICKRSEIQRPNVRHAICTVHHCPTNCINPNEYHSVSTVNPSRNPNSPWRACLDVLHASAPSGRSRRRDRHNLVRVVGTTDGYICRFGRKGSANPGAEVWQIEVA